VSPALVEEKEVAAALIGLEAAVVCVVAAGQERRSKVHLFAWNQGFAQDILSVCLLGSDGEGLEELAHRDKLKKYIDHGTVMGIAICGACCREYGVECEGLHC
jgi:hypothetical protein